jgi:hypothetical protein
LSFVVHDHSGPEHSQHVWTPSDNCNTIALIDAAGGTLMASMVMGYIAKQGEVAPGVEGRIKRLN